MSRKVQLTSKCKTQLSELAEKGKWPRLDDVLRGVYFCLENDAESHMEKSAFKFVAPVRGAVIKTRPSDGAPALLLLFWIPNSDTIQLESVSLIEDPES